MIGQPIARIWARCCGEGTFRRKDGTSPLEPNTVYGLVVRLLSGDITLRKVGRSYIKES